MIWVAFVVALLFIILCVAGVCDASRGDLAAAQHEAILDRLWDDGAHA